jgi:hypothetical protein
MKIWRKLKNSFNRFLENLAEENKKSFGNDKLDCCQLNRNQKLKH